MSAPDLLTILRRPITRTNAEVALLCEAALKAADEIERLTERIAQMRREHNAEIREIERDARAEIREAVSEERWKAHQLDDYGSY